MSEKTNCIPRKKCEHLATLSSCFGVTGEIVLTDSAVILLYAGLLGAGERLSLILTSVLPLFNGLLIVPAACVVSRFGCRNIILKACSFAFVMYLAAASAAWCGKGSVFVLSFSVLLFALSLSGFIAGWFPMLDSFVLPERRAVFLGKMRFCHQLTGTVFLVLSSLIAGKTPSVLLLQIILFGGALMFAGRGLCIAAIPVQPAVSGQNVLNWKNGLVRAMTNAPLTKFSLYQFLINIGSYAASPLAILFLKQELLVSADKLIFLSAMTLAGMLAGYLFSGKLLEKLGHVKCFIFLHFLFLPVGLLLFPVWINHSFSAVALLLMINSFGIAFFSILASDVMMKLAPPDNKTMAMAWCGAFFYGGAGGSRVLGSFLLGLLPAWCGISNYRWIFLFCFLLLLGAFALLPSACRAARLKESALL